MAKKFFRITSYNVCYTKLLRIGFVRKMINGGKALAVLGNHEINAILYFTKGSDGKRLKVPSASGQKMLEEVESQYPSEERLIRITSYNVCYTKLLRMVMDIVI